ncbi:MAG TPA: HAMP domain-containing sensor histidine kinase [Patescibacteria group bacterium]|jgi:signal transduction histidine kinase|nr:HAMP domain-containing sensor histidine kinase [Patescibacteria group bacterium]
MDCRRANIWRESIVVGVPDEAQKREQELKVRDYWPRTRKRALLLTIGMELILTIVASLALLLAGFEYNSVEFLFVVVAIIAASLGVNIVLMNILLSPLKDLSDALTHVSGEPSDVVAPNSTSPARRIDGLEPLLELIYGLSSQRGVSALSTDSEQENILKRALDQIDGGFMICDEHGKIVYASENAPVKEAQDESKELKLIFDTDLPFDDWLAQCREKEVKSQRTWLRVPDGLVGDPDRKIYDVIASYEKGSTAPVVISTYNRSADYQPEDDQLDFISFAAHELRGPVTVIRGYLDVFREELENPTIDARETSALLSRLIVSANRLSGYITNILNASRYDRRHLKMNLHEHTLAQVYAMIADDMGMRASTQNRLLTVSLPSDLPTVAVDPSSLSEVFSNLIDNAIKYSNEGGTVSVGASVDGDFVKVSVLDHGIGMPGNVVSNLFHKFYRSHRSRETVAGTGIGLYISKAIVEAHGGVIEVKSEEGKGSVFSFSVPIYASVADKLAASDNSNQAIIRKGSEGWIKNHAKFRG